MNAPRHLALAASLLLTAAIGLAGCAHKPPAAQTSCPACEETAAEETAAEETAASAGKEEPATVVEPPGDLRPEVRVMVVPPTCHGPEADCEKLLATDFPAIAVAHLAEHGYEGVAGRQAISTAASYQSAPGEIGLVEMLLAKLQNDGRPDRWRRETEIFQQLLLTREKVLSHLEVEGVLQAKLVLGEVEGKQEVEVVLRLELGDEGELAWQSRCVRQERSLTAAGALRCALEAIPAASRVRVG